MSSLSLSRSRDAVDALEELASVDPYRDERRALIAAVTGGRGTLPPDLRQAIVDRGRGEAPEGTIPGVLADLIELAIHDAPAIGDEHLEAAAEAGFDDEALFEAIVAAALGSSLARLERVDELIMESRR